MRTAEHRFHKAVLCYGKPNDVHEYPTYTYESGKALYDVVVLTGGELHYRTNCRPSDCTIHHELITKHYGL